MFYLNVTNICAAVYKEAFLLLEYIEIYSDWWFTVSCNVTYKNSACESPFEKKICFT